MDSFGCCQKVALSKMAQWWRCVFLYGNLFAIIFTSNCTFCCSKNVLTSCLKYLNFVATFNLNEMPRAFQDVSWRCDHCAIFQRATLWQEPKLSMSLTLTQRPIWHWNRWYPLVCRLHGWHSHVSFSFYLFRTHFYTISSIQARHQDKVIIFV